MIKYQPIKKLHSSRPKVLRIMEADHFRTFQAICMKIYGVRIHFEASFGLLFVAILVATMRIFLSSNDIQFRNYL